MNVRTLYDIAHQAQRIDLPRVTLDTGDALCVALDAIDAEKIRKSDLQKIGDALVRAGQPRPDFVEQVPDAVVRALRREVLTDDVAEAVRRLPADDGALLSKLAERVRGYDVMVGQLLALEKELAAKRWRWQFGFFTAGLILGLIVVVFGSSHS